MAAPSPVGLRYSITQISLVVRDLDATMEQYHQAFGWGPWRVFEADGVAIQHDAELHGAPADFKMRWAECFVGDDMNFELIESTAPGNPWHDIVEQHGEGFASIAVMFKTREESELVKAQFADAGIGITARARIGDHIEWYYLDTEPAFKIVIESGSGHAIDFVRPAYVYPSDHQ